LLGEATGRTDWGARWHEPWAVRRSVGSAGVGKAGDASCIATRDVRRVTMCRLSPYPTPRACRGVWEEFSGAAGRQAVRTIASSLSRGGRRMRTCIPRSRDAVHPSHQETLRFLWPLRRPRMHIRKHVRVPDYEQRQSLWRRFSTFWSTETRNNFIKFTHLNTLTV
jgi:hypothetical protein